MKRIIASLLILVVLILPVAAADSPSAWAKDVIDAIFEANLLDARMQGAYQSDISRRDFAYLGVRLYENITGNSAAIGDASFPDSDDPFVLRAKAIGVVNGYEDGTYRPAKAISRQELAVLFINALSAADQSLEIKEREIFDDDQSVAGWAKKSVYTARALGVVEGVGENVFDPTGTATREQAMLMFKRVNDRYAAGRPPVEQTEPAAQAVTPPSQSGLSDLMARELNLDDYSDKPVVLIFIDAQYPPCLEQLATIQKIYGEYRQTHHFIAVDCGAKKGATPSERLISRYDIKYSVVSGDCAIADSYRIDALPTTLVVDDQKIVARHAGTLDRDALSALLAADD